MKRQTVNIENVKRLIAADYPLTEDFRCVEIVIPDDDLYLKVLAGFVALLGQNYAWSGTPADRETRAQLWREAYALTDWEQCMSCEDVADCIENNEAVQDALEQNLIDNIRNSLDVQNALNDVYNQFGINPMPPAVSSADLIPAGVDCDQDKTWGAIVQLIDSMHQNNIDSFEIIEVAANLAERAALLYSAVPIVETLPVDEAVDYVQEIWTDDLFEAYNANDTTAYRDTLKCDLFCIATAGGCVLSVDDVFLYFISRISADPTNDFIQLIAYLVTGTWTGTQVNDMFFAGQILLMKYGNQFFGQIGIRPYQTYLEIGSRSPSDAWELICDTCPTVWCYEWDFAAGEITGWDVAAGEYSAGVGFVTDGIGDFPWTVDIGIVDVDDWDTSFLTDIRITAWTETPDSSGIKGAYYPPNPVQDTTPNTDAGDYVAYIIVTDTQPVAVRIQVSNSATPGNNRISKVRFSGTGDLPAWLVGGNEC